MKYYFVIPKYALEKEMWRRSIVAMLTVLHVAWEVADRYSDIFESGYIVVHAKTGKVAPL